MNQGQTTSDDVLKRIRSYINENFLYMRPDLELNDDDALLKKGIVDSMGVGEILEFLSHEFGVTVDDDDITEENLGSVAAIARYVSGEPVRSGEGGDALVV
jgi:acyl carrier protein